MFRSPLGLLGRLAGQALAPFCAAAALCAGPPAWADPPAAVGAVTVRSIDGAVVLTIEGDRPLQATTLSLRGPDRFVVDVRDARLRGPAATGPGAGLALRYRAAPQANGAARVVLDLSGPAQLMRRAVEADGRRLVFTLTAADGAVITPVARTFPTPSARTRLEPAPEPAFRRRTIVIDAGHGGRDPGAISPDGVREEAVTLAAALALRDALEARGGYRVALTRDADAYLTLEERVRRARAPQADLFISLHADSNPSPSARGVSVYTLSERGARRAQAVMDDHNWDLDLGPEAPEAAAVRDILVDLAQRETTDRSGVFARTVIRSMEGAAPLLSNTHRSAGFFVLLAPDVPAVLIEMGFLTNPEDARRLADPAAQARFAAALADAIDEHFTAPLLAARR
jgi:N-acetylmuramoyl-L-alanine amidase